MKSRSNYESSSKSYSSCSKIPSKVYCHHKLTAVLRTAKKGANEGKMFHGCPLWPKNSCGFFVLVNELGADSTSSRHCNKKCCEDQVVKLKTKNEKMKKELLELRIEVKKRSRGEKMALISLILSWVFFALSWMVKKN
ncbi:hypothetical protein RND81_13G033900 [Saponaria officinalis]|uniref:GRF-type domain-containing protein n=1 Tax=Saponaria officinalis TaxID=3572 RepID=A0AAW1GTJ2_SAPOF